MLLLNLLLLKTRLMRLVTSPRKKIGGRVLGRWSDGGDEVLGDGSGDANVACEVSNS